MSFESGKMALKPCKTAVESCETVIDVSKTEHVSEIVSLCVNCQKNGITRILVRNIPYFKNVAVMSFRCDACGFENSELMDTNEIQIKGCVYHIKLTSLSDFSRMVLKSSHATMKFEQIALEIPAKNPQLTTIEGILVKVTEDLDQMLIDTKQDVNSEYYTKIKNFCKSIQNVIEGKLFPLDLFIDDPSGNSFVEPNSGNDINWNYKQYIRSEEQNKVLGVFAADSIDKHEEINESEIDSFPGNCPNCARPCQNLLKKLDIPYFKEVIIMALYCDECGYKSNEVKSGGAIPKLGQKITVNVVNFPDDLSRDVLKSSSAAISIPEINLELSPGTLGGKFTTIEGLLIEVHDELYSRFFDTSSDSIEESKKKKWEAFLQELKDLRLGKKQFTFILDDPLAASHIQNTFAPDKDPEMTVEHYERSFEQNEFFGLNDIQTENY